MFCPRPFCLQGADVRNFAPPHTNERCDACAILFLQFWVKFACKVRMCEISHIRTSHRCDVRSGAAKKWLRIVRFWDYEQKFACKVRMCEISHIRTSHTCDVRSGAAEKWLPILRFWDYERKFACKVRCAIGCDRKWLRILRLFTKRCHRAWNMHFYGSLVIP